MVQKYDPEGKMDLSITIVDNGDSTFNVTDNRTKRLVAVVTGDVGFSYVFGHLKLKLHGVDDI